MAVFVLNQHSKALMPCTEKCAKQLLTRHRARIHRMMPFAIRIVDRAAASCVFQPLRVKLDPGSKITGIALVREINHYGVAVVSLFELLHRGRQISEAFNRRLELHNNVHDADKKGQLCVSVGAHIFPDRSVNVGLANMARLAAKLHLPATYEWAEEVSIATQGHAWLNIYSGEERIQTVGLWPGGVFLDRERAESTYGWIIRCVPPGEGQKLLNAIERRNNVAWTGYYNCASFVADIWNEVFPSDKITSQPTSLHKISSLGDAPFTRLVPPPPSPWGIIQTSISR